MLLQRIADWRAGLDRLGGDRLRPDARNGLEGDYVVSDTRAAARPFFVSKLRSSSEAGGRRSGYAETVEQRRALMKGETPMQLKHLFGLIAVICYGGATALTLVA